MHSISYLSIDVHTANIPHHLCVCFRSAVNKMTPENLAIVFAPNLFELDLSGPGASDPMQSIQFSQKVCRFLQKAIIHRAAQRNIAI